MNNLKRMHWKTNEKFSYCIRAFVFRVGSSGRKFLYSSTSFSIASICDCSLLRRFGSVVRMWLVNCWLSTRCRYDVPIRSAICLAQYIQDCINARKWHTCGICLEQNQTDHDSVHVRIISTHIVLVKQVFIMIKSLHIVQSWNISLRTVEHRVSSSREIQLSIWFTSHI